MWKTKNNKHKQSSNEQAKLLTDAIAKLDVLTAENREQAKLLTDAVTKVDVLTAENHEQAKLLTDAVTKVDVLTVAFSTLQSGYEIDRAMDKGRLNIQNFRETCTSSINVLKTVISSWNIPENIIKQINDLEEKIEYKTENFQTRLAELHYSFDTTVQDALTQNVLDIEEEVTDFFLNIDAEFKQLVIDVWHAVAEDKKLLFKEFSQVLRNAVVENSPNLIEMCNTMDVVAKMAKAKKEIFQEIENIRNTVHQKENLIVTETFLLVKITEKPKANREIKERELTRVTNEVKSYIEDVLAKIEKVQNKLETLVRIKKHRQKRLNNILLTIWFLAIPTLYAVTQYLNKEIPSNSLQLLAWSSISIILVTLYFFLSVACIRLMINLTVRLGKRAMSRTNITIYIFTIAILAIINHITIYLLPHRLFVLSLPIFLLFSQPDQTFTAILSIATLLEFSVLISLIIWIFKRTKSQLNKTSIL